MNSRTFLVLVCALLVTLAILYSSLENKQNFDQELLLPGLAVIVNKIDQIKLIGAGRTPIATLERGESGWSVAERYGYPADLGKIRQSILTLARSRIVEEKTSDPELYDRLGVQDVDADDATGVELSIRGPSETITLIVGDTGVQGDYAYIRRAGETRSWLVSAKLDLATDTADWLQQDVLDIGSDSVQAVTITHPDESVLRIEKASRDDENFAVMNVPGDRELSYASVANGIGLVLSGLSFDDVSPAAELSLEDVKPVTTRFECFDGLVVTAFTYNTDDTVWTAFEFSTDTELAGRFRGEDEAGDKDETVKGHADELSETLGPWRYKLPTFKSDQFVKRMEDMLKPAA